jgi:UDP-N-acetylmuramoyl-L-alanyl-D-glutamate--2,6-diaminopimelate ligase
LLSQAALSAARERPGLPPGPYLVAGLGRAGMAAASALERFAGARRVRAWDGFCSPELLASRDRLISRGIETSLGGDGSELLDGDGAPRCIVKSPGIPFDAALLASAAKRGLAVIDELELGWRLGRAPLIAVTGTNGKSTTALLILTSLWAMDVPAVLGGNSEFGPPLSAVSDRAPCVVCEVSSYQLEGCPELLPEAAVFTSLSRDHLHRHRTMDRYADCKKQLFVRPSRATPLGVVNVEQPFGRALACEVERSGGRVVRYGDHPDADYRLEACDWTPAAGRVRIRAPHGALSLDTRLPGRHNARNMTAALALAGALGLDEQAVTSAVASATVPGRFERVQAGQPFDVILDYANNPGALTQSLLTARRILDARPPARLHLVVSAAGAQDPARRPEMGRTACALADHVVLTTGSLLGEDPDTILDAVLRGTRATDGAVEVEGDRRTAIKRALLAASPGDLVLVAPCSLRRIRLDPSGAGPIFHDRTVIRELLGEP